MTRLTSLQLDVWSVGVAISELLTDKIFPNSDLNAVTLHLLALRQAAAVSEHSSSIDVFIPTDLALPSSLRDFLRHCFVVDPAKRLAASDLAKQYFSLPETIREPLANGDASLSLSPLSTLLLDLEKAEATDLCISPRALDGLPLSFLYYLWRLSGGDLEMEFHRVGVLRKSPPLSRIPRSLKNDTCEEFGASKDSSLLYSEQVVVISLDSLEQYLTEMIVSQTQKPLVDMDKAASESTVGAFEFETLEDGSPVMEALRIDEHSETFTVDDFVFVSKPFRTPFKNTNTQTSLMPFSIREQDISYQYFRMKMFIELLPQYPSSRNEIRRQSGTDIPPMLRGKVWAAILGVVGDYQRTYRSYDKELETATDRQIDVDIPRCHQYHQLLGSPTGHLKLKRLLKSWIAANPEFVYWQGSISCFGGSGLSVLNFGSRT
jgi:TBC domain-containing protein kinase-like protein